jgi:DNA repair exonuclease SbcCD ATPase subunit
LAEQTSSASQPEMGPDPRKVRFTRDRRRPEATAGEPAIPERAVLDRLEMRAAQLTRAHVRIEQLERELEQARQTGEELVAALEHEQAQSDRLERRVNQAEAALDSAIATEEELKLVLEQAGAVEAELERTRAQLEVVRGDAAARHLPLWRRVLWRLGRR